MADGNLHASGLGVRYPVASMRKALGDLANLPDGAAHGMSGQHYVDETYFAHEKRTLLQQGWHCVGRADELPNLGDYRALTLLDEQLIIVRTEEKIIALSNLCRHRSMPLAEGSGNARLFVCPYHAWSYRINGALQRAPRMENTGFDPKSCALPSFACMERFGFVYVSLSETPPDLDKHLDGLYEKLQPYEPAAFRVVHAAEEIWNTNWKSLVENFMEGYHLSVVHPVTLHAYTPTELCKKGPAGLGFTSYTAHYPDCIPSRGQGAAELEATQKHASFLFSVFPCQVVSISPSLLVSLSLMPISAGQVDVRWTMSVYGDDLDEETIKERITLWSKVNREDRDKLERMQKALGSRHAGSGPLAGVDYEGTVKDFLNWLAREDSRYL